MRRPQKLTFTSKTKPSDNLETEEKLRDIMRISGNITLDGTTYKTDIKDMEDLEELGNGTCGHVIKMKHKASGEIIAVKVSIGLLNANNFAVENFLVVNVQ